ncbi:MAG: hypothetical protein EXR73_07910 [Myxococcales bacterium]|nr:hypothetical protein [Myxococcales bacterium]
MTRAGGYGQSFAGKLLADGNSDAALAEADRAVGDAGDDPEPYLDRARVLTELGRGEAALVDLVRAIELDRAALVLDDSTVDDTAFTLLLDWARREAVRDVADAVAILHRYHTVLPAAARAHDDDVATWERRLRGERETWVRARVDD